MGTKLGKMRKARQETVKLTVQEHSLIKKIWTRVELEPKIHGTAFYLKFFAKYPQYIKYFLADPIKDDVNPDALMNVKFTVVMEVLGYLILDFHSKPKRFHQLIGYVGMLHKDMNLEEEDTNIFFSTLIDYLKDTMSDLMTDTCESGFNTMFGSIQELMMKSIAEERRNWAMLEDEDESVVARSNFKVLLPCSWFENSPRLIYGQPKDYWLLKKKEWDSKLSCWEMEGKATSTHTVHVQNIVVSTSSDDETEETGGDNAQDQSDTESHKTRESSQFQATSLILQRARYVNKGYLHSIPHFDQLIPNFSDVAVANEREESVLINDSEARSAGHVRLTPRERHRVEAAALRAMHAGPSGRLMSNNDGGSPRYSDGTSARESRRSTWYYEVNNGNKVSRPRNIHDGAT